MKGLTDDYMKYFSEADDGPIGIQKRRRFSTY